MITPQEISYQAQTTMKRDKMSQSIMTTLKNGTQQWSNEAGQLHREGDLPAVIYPDGSQEFWENDRLHRAGGLPAVILSNGCEYHWENGNPRFT